jgi:two-component system, chemotaxis family, chemotaxis protein CheY
MIVDDDRDLRESLADYLADEGYEVDLAASGIEAIERMRAAPLPEVVLVDLMMPDSDGFDFRARQCADPKLAAVPAIAMTAAGARVEARARALGFVSFLEKPFDPLLLLAELKRFASKDRGAPTP